MVLILVLVFFVVFTAYVAFDVVFAVWGAVVNFQHRLHYVMGGRSALLGFELIGRMSPGFCSPEEVSMLVKRVDCEDNGRICLVGYFAFWANPTR